MIDSTYFHAIALRSVEFDKDDAPWIEPDPFIDFGYTMDAETDESQPEEQVFMAEDSVNKRNSVISSEHTMPAENSKTPERSTPSESILRENKASKELSPTSPEKNDAASQPRYEIPMHTSTRNTNLKEPAAVSWRDKQPVLPSISNGQLFQSISEDNKQIDPHGNIQSDIDATEKPRQNIQQNVIKNEFSFTTEKKESLNRTPSILPPNDMQQDAFREKNDNKPRKLVIGQIIVEIIAPPKPSPVIKERIVERRPAPQPFSTAAAPGKFYFGLGQI